MATFWVKKNSHLMPRKKKKEEKYSFGCFTEKIGIGDFFGVTTKKELTSTASVSVSICETNVTNDFKNRTGPNVAVVRTSAE